MNLMSGFYNSFRSLRLGIEQCMGQRAGMRRRGTTARRGFLLFFWVVFNRNLNTYTVGKLMTLSTTLVANKISIFSPVEVQL